MNHIIARVLEPLSYLTRCGFNLIRMIFLLGFLYLIIYPLGLNKGGLFRGGVHQLEDRLTDIYRRANKMMDRVKIRRPEKVMVYL